MISLELIHYQENGLTKELNVSENGQICLYGLSHQEIILFEETIKHLSKELTKLKNMSKKQFDNIKEG